MFHLIEKSDIEKVCQSPIFQDIRREELEKALTHARVKTLRHREYIFRAGDSAQGFCLVLDGALKLIRHSPRGEEVIMHFALQGDLVGALLMNQPDQSSYPISAKSMGPTRVLSIPRETYRQFWQTHVEIQKRLNASLYQRMSNIQDEKTMARSPLRMRIANLLLKHIDTDSQSNNKSLSLALTRQEIADSLGVAVESVIRVMSDWQKDGSIQKSEEGPEVLDIKKLLAHLEA